MKQYKIQVGDQTFTRKSERDYTHLVVGVHFKGHEGWEPGAWLLGYAGSAALAQKRASSFDAKRFNEVRIIPITSDMVREIKQRPKQESCLPAENHKAVAEAFGRKS